MLGGLKRRLAQRRLQKFLSFASHGWLLVQRGRNYKLYPMERDNDADSYIVETEDGKEYYEDNLGMMRTLNGHPFGIATERGRPIVDAETAETAVAMDEKDDESKRLSPDSVVKIEDVMNHMTVGTLHPRDSDRSAKNPQFETRGTMHLPQSCDMTKADTVWRKPNGKPCSGSGRPTFGHTIARSLATSRHGISRMNGSNRSRPSRATQTAWPTSRSINSLPKRSQTAERTPSAGSPE